MARAGASCADQQHLPRKTLSDANRSASPDVDATGQQSLSISETFSSRQGEGKLTGKESFFIRTNGCNLRCWFCDTPYASWNPSGNSVAVADLVRLARNAGAKHVVLTGGEPLLPIAISDLAKTMMDSGFHLTIETAGTIDRPIACDLLSLSPKLASSAPCPTEHPRWNALHESRRLPIAIMRNLIDAANDHQVKFVVAGPEQVDEVAEIVDQLHVNREDVFLMPQGVSIEEMDAARQWLAPWCEAAGFHYCDRMQIRWYGNRRGT